MTQVTLGIGQHHSVATLRRRPHSHVKHEVQNTRQKYRLQNRQLVASDMPQNMVLATKQSDNM